MAKQHERMARHEEHIIDLTVAGTTTHLNPWNEKVHSADDTLGATHDKGTYHFFQAKELTLSLMMPPNANAKCKKKNDSENFQSVS